MYSGSDNPRAEKTRQQSVSYYRTTVSDNFRPPVRSNVCDSFCPAVSVVGRRLLIPVSVGIRLRLRRWGPRRVVLMEQARDLVVSVD